MKYVATMPGQIANTTMHDGCRRAVLRILATLVAKNSKNQQPQGILFDNYVNTPSV